MVELIGLVTMISLVWLLDSSLANESEAEQRRLSEGGQKKSGKGKRAAA
jgi:hypothetical protein